MIKGYDRKCEFSTCKNQAQHIHHKDRNRKNNNSNNLRYLCVPCHKKEHLDDNPDYENSMVFRSRDLVDEMQPQKEGYRLVGGFNLINDMG